MVKMRTNCFDRGTHRKYPVIIISELFVPKYKFRHAVSACIFRIVVTF